jgi:hypothetical protein
MENIIIEIKVTNEKGKSETASFPYDVYFKMKEEQNIDMFNDLLNSLVEKAKTNNK